MVRYEYIFEKDCWIVHKRIRGAEVSFIHSPKFDFPIPEDVVLKIAKKEFGNYSVFHAILYEEEAATKLIKPHLLIAYSNVGGYNNAEGNYLYDFKTEKFLIKPTIKSKMTLEQKKTLIKMIKEI
ncbi:MAG: hypothetical protein E6R13_06340 [Spirochaetes bacterium]|nr:MAG: hypothetical protein E6R13_06340 [Spirochaetota bacterium]